MEITELDTTLESEPGTSTSSEKLPEAICSFNVLEASSTVGKLKSLIVWLPREVIRDCCPESFRENYPRTTCIIDCAETFIQRPTILRSRGETYSNYKSYNTAKYLVVISPHGQIMFISKAFGGRASDKFIVEKSGFMNYLLPEEEIMADRGFTIDDLLFPLRVKLSIPAFTKNKPQLSARGCDNHKKDCQSTNTCRKGNSTTQGLQNSKWDCACIILLVCSALVNLRSDLIRDTNESDDSTYIHVQQLPCFKESSRRDDSSTTVIASREKPKIKAFKHHALTKHSDIGPMYCCVNISTIFKEVEDVWVNAFEELENSSPNTDDSKLPDYVSENGMKDNQHLLNHYKTERPMTTKNLEGWHSKNRTNIKALILDIIHLIELLQQQKSLTRCQQVQYSTGQKRVLRKR
ncbi:unnamed protein product [Mytilus coruscus]|uniref:DDE Tnp4 domain-containing protein n=1 Tax=Mytilus coruscus TaxID=42192 RepID=A0A6J8C1D5_MYTCO|nr:unnamed protein product [Mytilus coruscus]